MCYSSWNSYVFYFIECMDVFGNCFCIGKYNSIIYFGLECDGT